MDQIKKLYKSLTPAQRWSILICGALLTAGILWFTHWQREAGFRPLFSSLSAEDASAIVQKLKESGVDYRIGENGSSILVPQARVAELRLEMAGNGLPKTGRIGFEIFDKTNLGITDFAEHVNYRRAIEGELERSIISIAEVDQARVHVTFPKDSVYLDEREPAKASVLVRLRPGASLSPQNVAAITHLVASAVEGLTPNAVSVVDMQGNLLNRPRPTSAGIDLSDEALEYQQKIEHDLQQKVASTLEPLLGPDKFRTALSVECDMTSGEQSDEIFDPTKSVMVSSQRTEDTPGTTTVAGGRPGTASNLPNPPAPAPAVAHGSSRRTENVTYASSRTTRHVKLPQGAIKRISVAVLVDQNVQWQGKQRVLIPPTPETMKTIHDLVATAVGLDTARGDQLTVETLPFDSTLNTPPPNAPAIPAARKSPGKQPMKQLQNNPILLGAVAAGALIVILAFGFVLRRRRRRKIEIVQRTAALPEAASAADRVELSSARAGKPEVEAADESHRLEAPRVEVLTAELRESAARDSELWAGVVRAWLAEEDA